MEMVTDVTLPVDATEGNKSKDLQTTPKLPVVEVDEPKRVEEEAVQTIDVHSAKDLIYSDHRCLDVRTKEEFERGHVENSVNIPYLFFTPQGRVKNPDFLDMVSATCSKDDFIVVGCASGARSLQATKELLSVGFKHVKNMGGGYTAWVENGFLVNKPNLEILVQSA